MSRGHGSGRSARGHGKGSRTGRSRDQANRDNRSRQLNPRDSTYWAARSRGSSGSNKSSDTTSSGREWMMDQEAAKRIQSHSDRTGRNDDFKSRAQSAAERNKDQN